MTDAALTEVAGVPETLLGPAVVHSLPPTAPPAPWDVECDAVLWVTRPGRAATAALPPQLRDARVTAVVGGLVRYSATPVGPYAEVLGAVGGFRGRSLWGSVPFMAVDSKPGLVAGRLTWGLPKVLAVVDGSPGGGTVTARGAEGLSWVVSATAHATRSAVPVRGRATLRQVSAGTVVVSPVSASARMRPAVVRVVVRSDGPLADWLRPGRHPGVILTGVRLTLGQPRR